MKKLFPTILMALDFCAADIPVERRREIYTVINDAVTGATK